MLEELRSLVALLRCSGARFAVIGSVARSDSSPRDLDVVVSADRDDLERLLDGLKSVGGRWSMSGAAPTVDTLRTAGHGRCTTSFGPVDVFVRSMR